MAYKLSDFRKQTREIFNEAKSKPVHITRYDEIFELRLIDGDTGLKFKGIPLHVKPDVPKGTLYMLNAKPKRNSKLEIKPFSNFLDKKKGTRK